MGFVNEASFWLEIVVFFDTVRVNEVEAGTFGKYAGLEQDGGRVIRKVREVRVVVVQKK